MGGISEDCSRIGSRLLLLLIFKKEGRGKREKGEGEKRREKNVGFVVSLPCVLFVELYAVVGPKLAFF